MTTSHPDEPLDPYDKVGAAVNGGRLDAAGGLSDPTIPTRTKDFVYTANEHRINRGHSCIGDDKNQNLPSLDELLFVPLGCKSHNKREGVAYTCRRCWTKALIVW